MKKTRKRGKRSKKRFGKEILLLCLLCGLVVSCSSYNPSLYPSYDVLNPGEKVLENPVGFVYFDGMNWVIEWKEGYIPDPVRSYAIINEAMGIWIYELEEELKRRKK